MLPPSFKPGGKDSTRDEISRLAHRSISEGMVGQREDQMMEPKPVLSRTASVGGVSGISAPSQRAPQTLHQSLKVSSSSLKTAPVFGPPGPRSVFITPTKAIVSSSQVSGQVIKTETLQAGQTAFVIPSRVAEKENPLSPHNPPTLFFRPGQPPLLTSTNQVRPSQQPPILQAHRPVVQAQLRSVITPGHHLSANQSNNAVSQTVTTTLEQIQNKSPSGTPLQNPNINSAGLVSQPNDQKKLAYITSSQANGTSVLFGQNNRSLVPQSSPVKINGSNILVSQRDVQCMPQNNVSSTNQTVSVIKQQIIHSTNSPSNSISLTQKSLSSPLIFAKSGELDAANVISNGIGKEHVKPFTSITDILSSKISDSDLAKVVATYGGRY